MATDDQPPKKNGNQKKKERPSEILRYTGMSFQMATVIVLGILLGRWLDGDDGFPVFTLVLSLLSVALAIYIVIKETSR
jgi:F0F1-type ATP synthase assembly protein I